jgi:beta-alanine--pyruvate transaminase
MHGPEHMIELFHGYTYSAHPLACAASLATLDVYQEEGLFQRAADLAPYWEDAIHSLKGVGGVVDLRNMGLVAAIEMEPFPDKPTLRAYECLVKCYEKGVLIRTTADTIALSPPLIIEKAQIDELIGTVTDVIKSVH